MKKKHKTYMCGKCKTVFPVGRGHNARTCGVEKNSLHAGQTLSHHPISDFRNQRNWAKVSEESLKITNSGGAGETHPLVLVKKEVPPRKITAVIGTFSVGYIRLTGQVVLMRDGNPQEDVSLPRMWKKLYNYISDGTKGAWFDENGFLHNPNGPAVEDVGGLKEWWVHGNRHRLNDPAVEKANGDKEWWVKHKRHRIDGPAVEDTNGHKEWWVNGERHRLNGPAIEYADGSKEWWVEGNHHRLDGPAGIYANGTKEWWVNDCPMEDFADSPEIPEMMGKYFYFLCINENPHIRKRALANPNCPIEFKIANKVFNNKNR